MREFHNQRIIGIFVLSLLCLIFLSPKPTIAQVESDDLTGIKVAVYNGAGVMNSSRVALTNMFEWMNASVVEVNASQILNDFLDDCDILVIPGGAEGTCAIELQYLTGVNKVKEFVEKGGSFFGICGGATYGANYVNLFNGSMNPVSEPGSLIHMTTMDANQSSTGPDLSDCPAEFRTMYYASQYFVPAEGTDVHIIATYDYNGQAGMVAFEYEDGTVFLSSPHPEYEEDGDRDDTADYDYLDDPDSEWGLLFRVSKWLVEDSIIETASPTTTPTTTPSTNPLNLPLIGIVSVGGAIIVLTVAVLYRRMHE